MTLMRRAACWRRPVELVFYDDQSNPTNIPQLYTKLIEVDKVDLLIGPYATNMVAPAIPVLMQFKKMTIGILANAANSKLHYDQYFSMLPTGPEPQKAFSRGFFELAAGAKPRPKTVAIVAADAEFAQNAADGARQTISRDRRVRNRLRPELSAVDGRLHADHARGEGARPRHRLRCGLSAGFRRHRARRQRDRAHSQDVRGHLHRAAGDPDQDAAGAAAQRDHQQRGIPPVAGLHLPRHARAAGEVPCIARMQGMDPMGWAFPPLGYAAGQVLAQAVEGTKSLDHPTLAAYIRSHSFSTVVGDITFGKDGEWEKSRVVFTQFQNVTGNALDQFKDTTHEVVIWPNEYKSGDMIYPYSKAKNP